MNRGMKTIRGMGRAFRIMDDNGDRKIDKQEFYWGLQDLGAAVSKKEAEILLDYLDTNKDGVVSFDEFLVALRGDLNEFRTGYIKQAYDKLDVNKDGQVTLEDIAKLYDVSQHPDV